MKKSLLFFFLLYSILTFAQKVDTICFYRSSNIAFYLDTYQDWTHSINNAKRIGENAKIYPIVDNLKNEVPVIYVSTLQIDDTSISNRLTLDYKLARKENRKYQKHGLWFKHDIYKTFSQTLFIRDKINRIIIYLNPVIDNLLISFELVIKNRLATREELEYLSKTITSFRKMTQ